MMTLSIAEGITQQGSNATAILYYTASGSFLILLKSKFLSGFSFTITALYFSVFQLPFMTGNIKRCLIDRRKP